MLEIPIYKNLSSRYVFEIELDVTIYFLEFDYNAREEAWYLSIYDSSETLLLSGIKLVLYLPLIKQNQNITGLPTGDFILFDSENNITTAIVDFDSFGERFKLYYLTESEIGELYGT